MTRLLEARNLSKTFGRGLFGRKSTIALEDFSLAIDDTRATITAIAGESGSGKTTLARLLLGFLEPTSGEVLFKGKDIRRLTRAEWRTFRRQVQAIFQDPFESFNPFYKVDHVLITPLARFRLVSSASEGRARVEEALHLVGLRPEETLGRYPHQLSGGQRQRIMVARALLLRPRVIVADEPVSMVDASLRATILESLLRLNREFGISVIYITHDLATAFQVCDSIVVLYRGRAVEAGSIEQVIRDPQHPYTRLLVDSIPLPDPDARWGPSREGLPVSSASSVVTYACRFANRCPAAMPVCRDVPPPFFQTEAGRAVACYLYQDRPAISGAELAALLTPSPDAAVQQESQS